VATTQSAETLKNVLEKALEYQRRDLVSRPGWGTVTFEGVTADFDRIFSVLSQLNLLPIEQLPDQSINQISAEVTQVAAALKKVDSFTVEEGTPVPIRDQISHEVHQRADQLYTIAGPWIPFLAYSRGDVEKNIQRLTASVTDAQQLVDGAEQGIKHAMRKSTRLSPPHGKRPHTRAYRSLLATSKTNPSASKRSRRSGSARPFCSAHSPSPQQ
jgi:hypothetical protein